MYNEVTFGVNNFGKPKILSSKDSLAQLIQNLLFLCPGQLPSMPHIGINIRQYLRAHIEDEDLSGLKEDIAFQCSELIPFIDMTGLVVAPLNYDGRNTIFIVVPLNADDSGDELIMGVTKGTDGQVIFNYKIDDALV